MASVKGFDGKQTQHRFLSDDVNQIQEDDPVSTIVIIGPPTSGQDRSMENKDSEIWKAGLPEEITGEVEVFNICNNEIERMTSVEPPLAKK